MSPDCAQGKAVLRPTLHVFPQKDQGTGMGGWPRTGAGRPCRARAAGTARRVVRNGLRPPSRGAGPGGRGERAWLPEAPSGFEVTLAATSWARGARARQAWPVQEKQGHRPVWAVLGPREGTGGAGAVSCSGPPALVGVRQPVRSAVRAFPQPPRWAPRPPRAGPPGASALSSVVTVAAPEAQD